MGRRSLHTADELRELIITASTDLIREFGLEGLSAREIARQIDYSPGTIYNSFENLDDLVLTIEGRLLDSLADSLSDLPKTDDPRRRIHDLAARYFEFVKENPKLWNLLFEHHLSASRTVPDWYGEKIEQLIKKVEDALLELPGENKASAAQSARVLWAAMHGISSLSTANKVSGVTAGRAEAMLEDFIGTYLAGLRAATPSGS